MEQELQPLEHVDDLQWKVQYTLILLYAFIHCYCV